MQNALFKELKRMGMNEDIALDLPPPPPKQGLNVDELVELLSNMPRLGDDAESFAEDVRMARSNDSLPDSSWD